MESQRTEKGVDFANLKLEIFTDEGVIAYQSLCQEDWKLDLSNNLLKNLPCTLKNFEVKIDGNPLSLIPDSARLSWNKIKIYLDSVSNRATRWSECKLLLVGQEGVGKTYVLYFIIFPFLAQFQFLEGK